MYGKEKGMVREETRVNIEKLFNDVQNTPRGGNLQRSS
jgi:hypothetical protein